MRTFKVWRVGFPNGAAYYGVRPAETATSFRSRLRADAKGRTNNSRLLVAVRTRGLENVNFQMMAEFDTETEGLLLANRLIDELPVELRLNSHYLSSNGRRIQQARSAGAAGRFSAPKDATEPLTLISSKVISTPQ